MTHKAFPSVLDFALEIVQMQQRIEELESEVERLETYRTDFFKVLDDSKKATERLFGIAVAGALGDHETAEAIARS
jgi:hypothetical protein